MLTKIPFYYGVIRKTTVAFGSLFNNLMIVNDDASKKAKKIIKVPISYANKEKYSVRLSQDPSISKQKQITLPRMSFEITNYSYDSERKLNKIHKVRSDDGYLMQYTPIPYIVNFMLTSYTKTIEDNLQIMEQIIPYFSPDLTVTILMDEKMGIKQDIPFTLNDVNTEDLYDGDFEDTRMILTTYTFTARINLYGAIQGLTDYENKDHFGEDPLPLIKKVFVNVNGDTARYSAFVNPLEASINDNYTIDELWKEDSKE